MKRQNSLWALALTVMVIMSAVAISTQTRAIDMEIGQPTQPTYQIGPEEQRQDTRALWYNTNWGYRRLIRLTGTGTEYINYTMRIDLNTTNGFSTASFANMNALGTDKRILDSNSVTLQDTWTEYWNDTWEDATFYTKLDEIAAAGTTDYYMYYGNTAATSDMDNGPNTFLHFDDFSGDDYTNRAETQMSGPIATNVIYEKTSVTQFQPDGDTYWYEENNSLMGISLAYQDEPIVRSPVYDHYLAYGSLWNDSMNYSICGASSDATVGTFERFTNNPIINISFGEHENPDSVKATEPDWVTNMTVGKRKQLVNDATYQFVIYYSGLNDTRWGIAAANSTSSNTPDCTWTKQGVLLDAEDVAWASEVRKPIVTKVGEADFRMVFSGYDSGDWLLGYATSPGIMGPWTAFATSVMNLSAWGWDSIAITPTDLLGNGTQTWVSYAGVNAGGEGRQGIANCSEADPWLDWTKNRSHITYGNQYRSSTDQGDCQYGSWLVINDGLATEYLTFYHTVGNATHVSISDAKCLNTSWTAHGTQRASYTIWDADGDGDKSLYIDQNETYLLNDFNGSYEEGGADYHNITVTVDCWARGTGQVDNVSIIQRAGVAPWASRSHYASELNISDYKIDLVQALAGTETILDTETLDATYADRNDQILLNIWSMGTEMSSYTENMPDNHTGSANLSDDQHMKTIRRPELDNGNRRPGTNHSRRRRRRAPGPNDPGRRY